MPAQIDVTYAGNLRCAARLISTGRTVQTDAAVGHGGLGEEFTPTDLVIAGLGACIATTMAMVAQRHGIDLSGLSVCMEKDMAAAPARRIGTIGMTIAMPMGLDLSPADRERLENAARRCPVKQSLHPDIDIRMDFIYPDSLAGSQAPL
jgi:putative redox protein